MEFHYHDGIFFSLSVLLLQPFAFGRDGLVSRTGDWKGLELSEASSEVGQQIVKGSLDSETCQIMGVWSVTKLPPVAL